MQHIEAHRRRHFGEHDRGPIRCDPGDKLLDMAARGQSLGGARSVGRLLPEIELPAAVRAKDDPPAVRRPHRKPVLARVERQPCEHRAPQVPRPDVFLLIEAGERDARPVGREVRSHVGARRRGDGLLFAAPIDPHERARVCRETSRRVHVHERPVGRQGEIARAGALCGEPRQYRHRRSIRL